MMSVTEYFSRNGRSMFVVGIGNTDWTLIHQHRSRVKVSSADKEFGDMSEEDQARFAPSRRPEHIRAYNQNRYLKRKERKELEAERSPFQLYDVRVEDV